MSEPATTHASAAADATSVPSIVAFANDAGSAGKTTSAVTLAALLAEEGARVLLVDLDKQANATAAVGLNPAATTVTVGSVLLGQAELGEAVLPSPYDNLHVIPAGDQIKVEELHLATKLGKEQLLARALSEVRGYDYIILDCQAGATDFWPLSALVASRWVVSVTQPSAKELQGLPRIESAVSEVADAYRLELELGGIIPCLVPAATQGRAYVDAMAVLRGTYNELVTPPVRRSVTATNSYSWGEPLPHFAPKDPITEDYRAVLAYLRGRKVF